MNTSAQFLSTLQIVFLFIVFLFLVCRNSGYFGESLCSKQVGLISDAHQLTAHVRDHNLSTSLQPELTRENIHEFNNGHDFTSEKSVPDSCYKNIQEPSTPWPVMISPHASDIPPLHCELVIILAMLVNSFQKE